MDYGKRYGMKPRSSYWDYILAGRELGASKKLARGAEYYDEHKRPLTQLSVGDSVQIQNREGNHPLRWDRTRNVVERLEHRQYLVRNDGSGRVLLRTQGHLKKIRPEIRLVEWPELEGRQTEAGPQDELPVFFYAHVLFIAQSGHYSLLGLL